MDGVDDKDSALSAVDKLQYGLGAMTERSKGRDYLSLSRVHESLISKVYFLHVCKSASMEPSKSDSNRWCT